MTVTRKNTPTDVSVSTTDKAAEESEKAVTDTVSQRVAPLMTSSDGLLFYTDAIGSTFLLIHECNHCKQSVRKIVRSPMVFLNDTCLDCQIFLVPLTSPRPDAWDGSASDAGQAIEDYLAQREGLQ